LIQRKVEVVQLKNCQIGVFWSRFFYSHPFLFLCVNGLSTFQVYGVPLQVTSDDGM
jgi:hypothetical protein